MSAIAELILKQLMPPETNITDLQDGVKQFFVMIGDIHRRVVFIEEQNKILITEMRDMACVCRRPLLNKELTDD